VAKRSSIVLIALIVSGCGGATPASRGPATPQAMPLPTQAGRAAPPSLTPAPSLIPIYGTQFVVLQRRDTFVLASSLDTSTVGEMPAGVATSDWQWVYAAAPASDGTARTIVSKIGVGEGVSSAERTWSVEGDWSIPSVGLAATPAGLSTDGRTLIMVERTPRADATQFAIVATGSAATPRIISLPGRYGYDAVSDDGSRLYVIQYRSPESGSDYYVRSVDVASGTLDAPIIADKRASSDVMAGVALEQQRGSGGMVYTLYRGPEGPFVHMLFTRDRTAFCVNLPANWAGRDADAAAWGLAFDAAQQRLYAANARLGVVGEVNPSNFSVARTSTFNPTASFDLAKFGGGVPGSTGTNLALDAEGGLLYLADSTGVLVISTSDLKVRKRFLAGVPVTSLGVAANGKVLYVVTRDGSAMRVDAATGSVISKIAGGGYTRVVRITATG
jgi:hypothetical protein